MKTIVSFLMACRVISSGQAKPDTKLTPSEIVARHLESIGSAQARAGVHGTSIKGRIDMKKVFLTQGRKGIKRTPGNAAALCVFASLREKSFRVEFDFDLCPDGCHCAPTMG